MNANKTILLPENELTIVKDILKQYIPDCQVLAFGSRIKGTAKKHSDLDLAILSIKPLNLSTLADLTEAFSESDLNIRVDVLDFFRADKTFQEVIKQDFVVVQEGVNQRPHI
jgi:predicted nucleotidyltransferase